MGGNIVNIKRAKEEIRNTIEAYLLKDEEGNYEIPIIRQRPILILGAPGIGKTQIMEQVARECKVGLVSYTITHHTRQSAIGLPYISEKEFGGERKKVTEYTMSEIVASIYEKMKATGLQEGILFIDEINCVSETLAPAMLQFLQCKSFGNQQIPEGWIIVTAGNPPEYNKSVREFDVVTMDRIKKIVVEPDFEVWKEYAYQEQVHPVILAYLNARPRYFYYMEQTVEGKRFATPRGWEDVSRILQVYEKLNKTIDWEVVVQYIQNETIAKDFSNYLELSYKYKMDYQIEEILKGNISETLLKKIGRAAFDERVSVIGYLLSSISASFKRVLNEEYMIGKLYEPLKKLKEKDSQDSVKEMLLEMEAEFEKNIQAELFTREEKSLNKKAIERMETYVQTLRKEASSNIETPFTFLRKLFIVDKEVYEEMKMEAQAELEAVFDFMDIAFLNTQESVLFLTELNRNKICVKFLQDCDCERYYEYNKRLLFEEQNRSLLRRMEG